MKPKSDLRNQMVSGATNARLANPAEGDTAR